MKKRSGSKGKPMAGGSDERRARGPGKRVGAPAKAAGKPKKKAAPWLPDSFVERPSIGPAERNDRRIAAEAAPTARRGRGGSAATKRPSRYADPQAERESLRYENPILSREGIAKFLSESAELMTVERIAMKLGYRDEERLDALTRRLTAMVRDGQLLVNRRGGYGVAEKLDLIAGSVIANPDGFGFLKPDDGSDDLFIPPNEMRAVMHGDRVLVNVTNIDRRGRREAAIAEVLERRRPRLVGRFDERRGLGIVIPDDRRLHQDVLIPPDQRGGASAGQIVVAEIVEPPTKERPPLGRVVAVLGEKLTASLIVRVAIESHGLPHEWPIDVTREAERVEPQVTKQDREMRVDLRDTPLVTIDGEDARDFDDAVFCEPRKGGGWRLLVAIADVSHYVPVGSALDKEAFDRATSVYFPGFVVPMLPETLSNGICSLNPNVERLCMVCEMTVGADGEVSRSRFYPAVMRSHARLTYTRVWRAIGERDADERAAMADLLPHLENLHALYKAFVKRRSERGAIEFESQEVKFSLGAAGEVLAMQPQARNDAHKLIEECMIAANVEAAKFLNKAKVPAPYRVHAPPPEEKFEELQSFLAEFGLRLPPHASVKPADYSALLRKIRKRPDALLLEQVLLRSQSLAVYHPDCNGHFGLALEAYAHFTSPIRRYPDLLVHRAIRHVLNGGKAANYEAGPSEMLARAQHCSQRERRADEASREVNERYQCAWMSKHVGSEFDGIISGVTSFGLFVGIADTGVTGLIHVTQLPNDYYHFDAGRREMVGDRQGLRFRLGDSLRVQVLRASMEERKVDLRLVPPAATKEQGKKKR